MGSNNFKLISFTFFFAIIYLSHTQPCKTTASDGTVYDLSRLMAVEIGAYDDQKLWLYNISICHNSLKCDICQSAGYCQSGFLSGTKYEFCIGSFKSIVGRPGGTGVDVIYNEPQQGRIGTVKITCDPSGPLVARMKAISSSSLTGYEFLFDSVAACNSACGTATGCGSCTENGCLWCLDTSSCVNPTNVVCRNFIRHPEICPDPCKKFNSCGTCANGECAWCLGNNICVQLDVINKCDGGVVQDPKFCS